MSYKDLLKEYNNAQKVANKALQALKVYDSGYIWLVQICSYGSSSWNNYKNIHGVEKLVGEFGDGHDGLLSIFTTDPKAVAPNDFGCVKEFKILSQKEISDMDTPYRSKSDGLLSFILPK
jgi:hypothetical protein